MYALVKSMPMIINEDKNLKKTEKVQINVRYLKHISSVRSVKIVEI